LGVAGSATGTMNWQGATSGTVNMTVAAAAGSWTFTLPPDDGDNLEFLQTNGSGVTTWVAVSAPSAASKCEMEAASSTTVYASPGTTKNHPGVAKAWAAWGATGVSSPCYNISGDCDIGTGKWKFCFGTDFSSASYILVFGRESCDGSPQPLVSPCACHQLAGSVIIYQRNTDDNLIDPAAGELVFFAAYGDQ
jgi:hypothetical protein